MKFKLLVLSFLLSATLSWGQISITTLGATSTQDFNNLPTTGTAITPAGAPFTQGWSFLEGSTNANMTYDSGTGSATAGNTYSFGVAGVNLVGDRAFGMLQSGSLTSILGFKFTNNTGSTVTSITVGYTGEIWRLSAAADNLNFSYQVGNVALNAAAGWTNVAALNFTTPTIGVAAAVDGNSATRRTVIAPVVISGLSIPDGATVTLRWVDSTGSSSAGMGIDDFSIVCDATVCTSTTPVGVISGTTPACGNSNLSFSGTAVGPEVYYWQTSATGTLTTNNASVVLNVTTSGNYYVRTYNGTCWSASSVGPYAVTINTPVTITAQPVNRVIADGSNTTFAVTATGTGLTYQWQVNTGSGFVNLSNGGVYSTVTAATLTITGATLAMNGYLYRCIVSGASPCAGVTSNSGSLTVNNVSPSNPTNASACYGNTSVALSWTASGSSTDGYMVFALAGATAPASASPGNANSYTANADFSLATVVTPSLGKCVYKGTGTSVTITGLTNAANYSFKVVAYVGNTQTGWSSGISANGSWNIPVTNVVVDVPEVSSLAASVASGQSALTWNRPTPLACYDEYLVVANQGSVVFTPTGDGSAYTANSVYSTSNQVVYKGSGAATTVTGLTNGLSYCYKVFVRRGTEWSNGVEVCQTPSLVYCSLTATNTGFEHISNVTVSTDINNNTGSSGYANYTAQVANATIGVGTPLSVTISSSYATDNVYAYVDWNKDGDWLDAGENVTLSYTAVAGTFAATGTITPPVTALTGNTRMRVVVVDGTISDACNGAANFTYGEVEDYTINVTSACTPTHTITTVTPASGPVGTEVTINGTGLTGTTVSFSGINATILSNTGTQIIAVIPAGATSGMLSVNDAQPCAIDTAFTIISQDITSCEGASTTDLIIYELHDEQSGDGGFITLYNGTAATVDLINYSIYRAGDYGNAMVNYAALSGTIAPGALGVVTVDAASCGTATNGDINAGFNENDQIQLRNAAGTVVIDDVHAYIPGPGYYMVRNTGALSARTSYVAADWSTTPLIAGQCIPSAGLIPPSSGVPPSVTSHPTYLPSCSSTSVILTTAGTEGFAGGLTLAYQWYFAAPGSATWTIVNDGGIYSGATTASLNISVVTGVINYQYYCQIRENSATCYSASNAIKVTDTNATTWNGSGWSNGIPTLTKVAIIDGTYVTATNGNFSCCSLTVNGTRTLTISSGGYVEVQNNVNNSGSINIANDGQLIQINETDTNSGTYAGTAFQVNRTVDNLRRLDYVYWSAPTENYNISAINGSLRYYWDTTAANPNGTQGYWLAAAGAMTKGQGYIVRGPSTFTTPQTLNVNFTGKPFNGQFTYPITRGTDAGSMNDNLILVGNPYPSAIDADLFLSANTNIEGAVHIWTHGTLPSTAITSPFYQNFVANYTMNDYIVYNGTATTIPMAFDGKIASGQGFFIKMNEAGAVSQTITFNNAMRGSSATAILNNSQFFRDANGNEVTEKNRIWLDLINPSEKISTTVVGYVSGATMEKDNYYDAYAKLNSGLSFYSKIGNEAIHIQGRALPFNAEDKVALGMEIPASGNHKIAIRYVDGLFSGNQTIYLEDKKLNIIHDLKANPYAFTVDNIGFENDRFVLRFTNSTLSNDDFDATANSVVIYANESIQVSSSLERIKEVVVYDVLGRTITVKKNVNGTTAELTNVRPTQSPLIVKVTLENDQVITKKVVY